MRQLSVLPPEKYIVASTVSSCFLCKASFGALGVVLRATKTHCHACGRVFCQKCASKKATLSDGERHRVCNRCAMKCDSMGAARPDVPPNPKSPRAASRPMERCDTAQTASTTARSKSPSLYKPTVFTQRALNEDKEFKSHAKFTKQNAVFSAPGARAPTTTTVKVVIPTLRTPRTAVTTPTATPRGVSADRRSTTPGARMSSVPTGRLSAPPSRPRATSPATPREPSEAKKASLARASSVVHERQERANAPSTAFRSNSPRLAVPTTTNRTSPGPGAYRSSPTPTSVRAPSPSSTFKSRSPRLPVTPADPKQVPILRTSTAARGPPTATVAKRPVSPSPFFRSTTPRSQTPGGRKPTTGEALGPGCYAVPGPTASRGVAIHGRVNSPRAYPTPGPGQYKVVSTLLS